MARRATLADKWLLARWPVEALDAKRVQDPPLADIAGVRSYILTLFDRALQGQLLILIVTGPVGSGKTTVLKTLHRLITRYGYKSFYVDGEGRGCWEIYERVCNNLGCATCTVDCIADKLLEVSHASGFAGLFIDDVERCAKEEPELVTLLLSKLLRMAEELRGRLLAAIALNNEVFASLTGTPGFIPVLKSSLVEVVDLESFLVSSIEDLKKLYFVYLQRARPENLDAKTRKLLANNPLHPIRDERVLAALYDLIGPSTPRTYLLYLDRLLSAAAKSKSTEITLTHVNTLIGMVERGGARVVVRKPVMMLTEWYARGILTGGLAALGGLSLTLALHTANNLLRLVYLGLAVAFFIGSGVLHLLNVMRGKGK